MIQSQKVVPNVETASHSNEKDTLMESLVWSISWSESTSAARSVWGYSTISSSQIQVASSYEATSSGEVPMTPNNDDALATKEKNWWCVEGQWKIYQDAKMKNAKGKMDGLNTEEH